MRTNRLAPVVLLLVAGCAGSGTRPAPSPVPTPTPSAPTPNAGFPLTPEDKAEIEKKKERVEEISKILSDRVAKEEAPRVSGEGEIVTDPATGQQQQRVEKSRAYLASGGRLYLTFLGDKTGFPILREDEKAWYIPVPVQKKAQTKAQQESEEALGARIIPLPAAEAEVVTPSPSQVKLRLQEISEGLPTEGMWRENFAMADLDGDGRPEIVCPAPRLSGRDLQIFKWDGKRWARPEGLTFEDPEKVGFEYGGVACADMDGDGKIDVVYGRHGGGPAIAFNKGGFHFVIETRGLAQLMTTRALAIGDLDGDGHPDVMAVSDEPEYVDVKRAEAEGVANARLPRKGGYVPGIDARAFLWRDGRYKEVHEGLEEACFGYSIGLFAPAPDGKAPFYASGCRYNGNPVVIHEFDRATGQFTSLPPDVGERYALHHGTAMGIYHGHPAAFVSWSKSSPEGGRPNISGYGVSVYYRDGDTWKRARILKTLHETVLSQGLAAGDLNGDGLDDVVFGDDAEGRLRVFLQRKDGTFEEIAKELEPTYVNHMTAVRLADIDGDGRLDVVFTTQPLTSDPTRSGGVRAFLNRR